MRTFLCLLSCFSLFLPSCGYRWGKGEIGERYATISVPYAEGDGEGILTAAIINQLSKKGSLAYRSCAADLVLNVCLLDPSDENIGFIYANPRSGKSSRVLVSHEARLSIAAKVSLIERATGKSVFGPLTIRSYLDFDFEPDLSKSDDHTLALGQLEMHELAKDAAFPALYTLLAEKIVDYVNHSW